MRTGKSSTVLAAGLVGLLVAGWAAAEVWAEAEELDEREQALIETLSGATLVGSFTVTGREDGDELRQERYAIREVEKVQDNLFLFRVRIQYGERDTTVAAPLVVIWSGDTPVITLTDASLPGMGRYTARVLIYGDHYAGYWSAGEVEGTMFGVVEREAD